MGTIINRTAAFYLKYTLNNLKNHTYYLKYTLNFITYTFFHIILILKFMYFI